jgi:hypothetical protein
LDDAKLDFEEEKKHKNDVDLDDIDSIKGKIKKIERCLSFDKNAENSDTDNAPPSPKVRPRGSNLIKRFKYEIDNQVNHDEEHAQLLSTSSKSSIKNPGKRILTDNSEYDENKQHIKLKIKLVKNETIDDFLNVNNTTTYQTVDSTLQTRSEQKQSFLGQQTMTKEELFDTSDCLYNDDGDESTSQLDTSSYSQNEQNQIDSQTNTSYIQNHENFNTDSGNNHNNHNNNSDYIIDDSTLNNLSCLDDFIMNEDELAVQSILDNYN